MVKHCNFCNSDRDESDFHWRNKSRGIRISKCRFCSSEYSKNHYRKNKKMYLRKAQKHNSAKADALTKFLLEYLKTHPCLDCGETDLVVLQFDHVKGEKKFNITSRTGHRNFEEVLKEIKKCEVRCANCHLKKTAERGNWRRHRFLALFV
jgi:hypothetical protein